MKNARSLITALALISASIASAQVYTQTNEAGGNRIVEIATNGDGSLGKARYFGTGGKGTGAGLGIQGAVTLSEDHRFLFAVNAGSNDISTFWLGPNGPALVSRIGSRGMKPVSVTSHGSLLYVVNAGDKANIAGFRVSENGQLSPLPGSARRLSRMDSVPGQIGINPEGDTVYVTEKNTNRIDFYALNPWGGVASSDWVSSPGETPFGFAFGRRGKLFVSEAFGGAVNGSAVSSFLTGDDGYAAAAAASVPTFQTAACWVAVSVDGRFVYTANAGSDSVTGYRAFDNGALSILTASGATGKTPTGAGATDLATDPGHLFVLAGKKGMIVAFGIDDDGKLKTTDHVAGLPTTVTGLAVR